MAIPIQDFEFLDLSNVNDSERHQLQNVLYAPRDPNGRYPELPWCGGGSLQHLVEPPPPPLNWMSHQNYDECENLVNGEDDNGTESEGEEEDGDESQNESEMISEPGVGIGHHSNNVYATKSVPPSLSSSSSMPVFAATPTYSNVYVNNMTANVNVHHGFSLAASNMPPPPVPPVAVHPNFNGGHHQQPSTPSGGHHPPPIYMHTPPNVVPLQQQPPQTLASVHSSDASSNTNSGVNSRKQRNKSGTTPLPGRRMEAPPPPQPAMEVQQPPHPMHQQNFQPSFHHPSFYAPHPGTFYSVHQHGPPPPGSHFMPQQVPLFHGPPMYPPNYVPQMYTPHPHQNLPPPPHSLPVSHVENNSTVSGGSHMTPPPSQLDTHKQHPHHQQHQHHQTNSLPLKRSSPSTREHAAAPTVGRPQQQQEQQTAPAGVSSGGGHVEQHHHQMVEQAAQECWQGHNGDGEEYEEEDDDDGEYVEDGGGRAEYAEHSNHNETEANNESQHHHYQILQSTESASSGATNSNPGKSITSISQQQSGAGNNYESTTSSYSATTPAYNNGPYPSDGQYYNNKTASNNSSDNNTSSSSIDPENGVIPAAAAATTKHSPNACKTSTREGVPSSATISQDVLPLSSEPSSSPSVVVCAANSTTTSSPATAAATGIVDVEASAPRTPTWASLFKKSASSSSNFDSTTGGGSPLSGVGSAANKPCARVEPLNSSYSTHGLKNDAEGEDERGGVSSWPQTTIRRSTRGAHNNSSYGSSTYNNGHESERKYTSSNHSQSSISNDATSQTLGKLLINSKLDHKGISLQPRGLINRSNYCYINATLQALIACPPFYNLLRNINKNRSHYYRNYRSSSSSSVTSPESSHTPIFNAMLQLANEFSYLQLTPGVRREPKSRDDVDITTGAPFEPTYVYQILSTIKSESAFNVEGRQEDAEEFLAFLLNGLNDEMLELFKSQSPKYEKEGALSQTNQSHSAIGNQKADLSGGNGGGGRNKLTNGDVNGDVHTDADDGDWKEVTKDSKNKGSIVRRHTSVLDKTPVSEIFRGHLRTKVHRVSDSTITENIQPFFTLPLDIEKVSSVKEALDQLVLREGLEGVTSTKTNEETEAYQTVTIEELPYVLLLHLKCFDYKLQSCMKIQKPIEFNVTLNLDSKLLSSSKSKKLGPTSGQRNKQYKLFAVVYHDGKEASKGHYITDVFHVGYSGWIRYDDSNVRFVPENEVLHPKPPRVPYILYYRRADTIVSKNLSPSS